MATLELASVVKTFDKATIIHGVDLTVSDGEFVVFVGPSGCGKSTLLRIISGLEPASSGDIRIDGQRVNEVSAAHRGCSMVFQSYALYPHMSVYDNMAFGLENLGVARPVIESKVNAAAALLQLRPLLQRKPTQLSGGQRQRAAIGRSIVREPKLFLFDEPLSNLDAELRVSMRAEIQRPARPPGRDHDLRHPRPGRGHDHGRQDRGAARRPHRAGRLPAGARTTGPATSSWPASSAARA